MGVLYHQYCTVRLRWNQTGERERHFGQIPPPYMPDEYHHDPWVRILERQYQRTESAGSVKGHLGEEKECGWDFTQQKVPTRSLGVRLYCVLYAVYCMFTVYRSSNNEIYNRSKDCIPYDGQEY